MSYEAIAFLTSAGLIVTGASGLVWARHLMSEGRRRTLAARAARRN